MVENCEAVRRPRGRPQVRSDEETRALVVEAAARAFTSAGYAAASMNSVAADAGVSTKTMYRLVPTKAELFGLVITDRIGRFMLAFDAAALEGLELETALERILVAYGHLTMEAETIAINRLVIGESERFPELATNFYRDAITRTADVIVAWLERQTARGALRIDDPVLAAGMLRGMMVMEPQRAALLGQRAVPDAAEIEMRAKACTALFLDGCRGR